MEEPQRITSALAPVVPVLRVQQGLLGLLDGLVQVRRGATPSLEVALTIIRITRVFGHLAEEPQSLVEATLPCATRNFGTCDPIGQQAHEVVGTCPIDGQIFHQDLLPLHQVR